MSTPGDVDFGRQVHNALVHLHDPAFLETHPLTRLVDPPRDGRPLQQGKVLRDSLLAAIDDLKPAPNLPPTSHAWRGHQILTLRYVEALDAATVRARLAVSKSEFQRDHRAALDAMTSLLQNRWRPAPEEMTATNGEARGAAGRHRDCVRSALSHRYLVPTSLSSFVGRDREIADVARLLDKTRLVTLTGPPGCGKTRLALEVAAAQRARFRDGVVFVPLATTREPTLALSAIGRTLGFQERDGSDLADSLTGWLRDKYLLLVLDNLEQVVGFGPRLVEILGPARDLRVFITSRTPLRVRGEQVYSLSPLATPDPPRELPVEVVAGSPAVQLFVDRARAARPGFALTAANAPVVAEIVRRLDGLPLAIELAAARSSLLAPDALLRRLGPCLPLLSGGPRDLPARQQTLLDAIAWSYALLDDSRRALFRRLAVFEGTFGPEAAEAVCADPGAAESVDSQPGATDAVSYRVAAPDVFDGLQLLVDNSLVRTFGARDGEPCFDLLDTLREFAASQLVARGEADAVGDRHADFYVRLAREAAVAVSSPERDAWEDRLERGLDNLVAAVRWSAAHGEVEAAFRAVGDLTCFWTGHAPDVLRRWLVDLLHETATLAPSAGRGRGLATLAMLARDQNDLMVARAALEDAVRISTVAGDTWEEVFARRMLSRLAMEEGDWVRGVELAEDAMAVARASEDPLAIKSANLQLGQAAFCAGQLSRSRELLQLCIGATPDDSSAREIATFLNWLGHVATARGDFGEAWDRYVEALEWRRRSEYRVGFAFALTGFAHLAAARGEHDRAARLSAAAAAICLAAGIAANRSQEPGVRERLAASRLAITPEAFDMAWAEGRRMTVEEACAYALAGRTD